MRRLRRAAVTFPARLRAGVVSPVVRASETSKEPNHQPIEIDQVQWKYEELLRSVNYRAIIQNANLQYHMKG